jgi:glycosyltransferase involved in cell wall biosynthesis
MEILIADGLSTDGTREEIRSFLKTHPEIQVKVLDNPRRSIPAGLNIALREAQGEYIIRVDAHSRPHPNYVERCVQILDSGVGDNVGGVWEIMPGSTSWIARSIATAAAHPLGVGDARYRLGGKAQCVDTVPFGAFRRDLVSKIGFFDESLLTNEDYEFNVRIRKTGGKVWFDPSIRAVYYARADFLSLARQYYRYGFWKGRMLLRYPETIRWRQLLPPLFVLGLIILLVLSAFWAIVRMILMAALGVYLLILLSSGIQVALKKGDLSLIIGFPMAVATMHFSWGSALLWSLVRP